MTTYYGFKSTGADEIPAWFCTPAAALRFARGCGMDKPEVDEDGVVTDDGARGFRQPLTEADLDTTHTPGDDLMDTLRSPWGVEYVIAVRTHYAGPSRSAWTLYRDIDTPLGEYTIYETRQAAMDAVDTAEGYDAATRMHHRAHNVASIETRVMRADSRIARRIMR